MDIKVGVNGFGLRRVFAEGFDFAIEEVKKAGCSSIEACVGFPFDPANLPGMIAEVQEKGDTLASIWPLEEAAEQIARVREAGLAVISIHIMAFIVKPEEFAAYVPSIIELSKATGVKYFVTSPSKKVGEVEPFIPMYREVSNTLAEEGIHLVLHNHEQECTMINGTTSLDMLLAECPKLKLELDAGWAKFAGADAVALMEKYRDRLVLVHLKDIKADASPETRETCFTAIGEGSIPLQAIMDKAAELQICEHGIIIDQDDSEGSICDDLCRGVGHIKACC